jgi:lipoprotein-releasing system permease protein
LTLPFEIVVALRFLREGRFQTWLIVGGAGIGVAVVIFITALVNGLQANTIKRTLGTQAHVVLRPPEEVAVPQRVAGTAGAVLPSVQARAQRLRSIDQWQPLEAMLDQRVGVAAVSPIVSGPAFAVRGDANKSVAVQGVLPDRYTQVIRMDDKLVAGAFRVQPGEAVVGKDLASDLGIGVGDRFRLVTGSGSTQVDDAYVVTGLVDLGIRDMNRRAVYLGFRTAQALFDLPGGASQIDLAVDDLFGAEATAQALARETGLTADSWMKTNEQLLAAINAQTITTRTIRVFVSIVVVLGIASVLVVWVVQKRREIGILRAMGASRGRIQRVFLLQGAMVALIGAILGSALATLMIRIFGKIARNMDGTPLFALAIDPALYLWTVVGAIVAGVLAAAAPARRAARLDPAQAIRM